MVLKNQVSAAFAFTEDMQAASGPSIHPCWLSEAQVCEVTCCRVT